MESLTGSNLSQSLSGNSIQGDLISVTQSPVIGKNKTQRVTTTSKSSATGQTVSVLVEELKDGVLLCRQFNQYAPTRISVREIYENDGSFVCSETEKHDADNRITKIVIRGSGKSSTARIMCGDVELRATERSILIESPRASYSYLPFEGKWSSFYKEIGMKLEMKASYLKNPDAIVEGPDGIKLVFRNGRIADMLLANEFQIHECSGNSVPGILS
jgi:hypothetical protein